MRISIALSCNADLPIVSSSYWRPLRYFTASMVALLEVCNAADIRLFAAIILSNDVEVRPALLAIDVRSASAFFTSVLSTLIFRLAKSAKAVPHFCCQAALCPFIAQSAILKHPYLHSVYSQNQSCPLQSSAYAHHPKLLAKNKARGSWLPKLAKA